MKQTILKTALIVTMTLTSPLLLQAQTDLSYGAGADIVSEYVWRGQLLTDEPVIQPYVEVSSGGLCLNIWSSIDTTDTNEVGNETYRIQEVDYTLSYGGTVTEGLDMEGGVIYYDFPGTGFDATQEAYVSASLSDILLTPSLTVYYDFDEVEGIYANAGIGHAFELSERLSLSLSGSLGWGDKDYNMGYFTVDDSGLNDTVDDSGLNDLAISTSLDYEVNETFSMSFFLAHSELVDGDVEDAVNDSGITTGGIGFYFSY